MKIQIFAKTRSLRYALIAAIAALAVACSPENNAILKVGQKSMADQRDVTFDATRSFSAPQPRVHAAVMSVIRAREYTLVGVEPDQSEITLTYPYSFSRNLWGGKMSIWLTRSNDKINVRIGVYEINKTVPGGLLNPMLDEIATALQ